MSRASTQVGIDLLKSGSTHNLEIEIVDRAELHEGDLDYILGCRPASSIPRVDEESYRPFIGIDIFYDEESSLKGIVLVYDSRALAIRVPANVAKTSSKAYEEEKAAILRKISKPEEKLKGRTKSQPVASRPAYIEILRKLLSSDLAGFGMAQISLTLWYYLHERVSGVNLSTATSEPNLPPKPPPPATKGDKDAISHSAAQEEHSAGKSGSKRGKGAPRKQKPGGGNDSRGRKGSKNDDSIEKVEDKSELASLPPVIPPDEEPLNLDRNISSPGEVVKKIYPNVSVSEIDGPFMGNENALNLGDRIVEASIRAWISFVVADKQNTMVQNAPMVNPSHLRDKELAFFAESMIIKWRVLGEINPLRTLQRDQYGSKGGLLESKKYETKIRAGAHQYITYDENGEEKRIYLQRVLGERPKHTQLVENEDEEPQTPSRQMPTSNNQSSNSGRGRGSQQRRRGQVREYEEDTSEFQEPDSSTIAPDPNQMSLELPEDIEVKLYGRDEATQADKQRDMFLLRLLEGRGSFHGPKYKDCAFIRRVWFPTLAQITVGEQRAARKAEKKRGKNSWMDDDWGDDTDPEEVARIQALTLAEGGEDIDDETEDEDVGRRDPRRGVRLPEEIKLNKSQEAVVGRVVAPNPLSRTRATIVHGPPGTGKTSTIAAAVWVLGEIGERCWIIAQSNDGIRNVAEKLQDVGFNDFVLLVAADYSAYRGDRYARLGSLQFSTSKLKLAPYQDRVCKAKAVLCTLSTLSSKFLSMKHIFPRRPLKHLIIDEASQIDMTSEFMHIFYQHRSTLQSVCWFGDPNQLPPYGWSEGTKIKDIFQVKHLQANAKLLDTSYRLPVPIGKHISRAVYENELKTFDKHKVQLAEKAVVFIDVADGAEEAAGSKMTSVKNQAEADLVLEVVKMYYERSVKQDWEDEEDRLEYEIITPYEGQRDLVERMVKNAGIKKVNGERQVYNVDSFQGNESDYIITTIAKTGGRGFLGSINRLNVLLTRCKRGLIVVTQKDFVQRAGGLLQGLWFSLEPYDPWVSAEDVLKGYVDLPGSPAPNVRPPATDAPPAVPASRQSIPPRPGLKVQASVASAVRQGMTRPPTETSSAPVSGVWGQSQGVNRVKKVHPWGQ